MWARTWLRSTAAGGGLEQHVDDVAEQGPDAGDNQGMASEAIESARV